MSRRTRAIAAGALLTLSIPVIACKTAEAPTTTAQLTAMLPDRSKDQNIELGRQHKTALELSQALRLEAKSGRPLEWTRLPDWSFSSLVGAKPTLPRSWLFQAKALKTSAGHHSPW